MRRFNLANLVIFTAGSAFPAVSMVALSHHQAQTIREFFSPQIANVSTTSPR
ncbi:hypothetical protein [Suttonella ornithocola]|uniref:hypothetical protein n=1 Tax=Suttonella ornithocola TaxID=279832 RepID=UPI000A00D0F2